MESIAHSIDLPTLAQEWAPAPPRDIVKPFKSRVSNRLTVLFVESISRTEWHALAGFVRECDTPKCIFVFNTTASTRNGAGEFMSAIQRSPIQSYGYGFQISGPALYTTWHMAGSFAHPAATIGPICDGQGFMQNNATLAYDTSHHHVCMSRLSLERLCHGASYSGEQAEATGAINITKSLDSIVEAWQ